MPFTASRGCRIHYRALGEGPAVVLVQGLGLSSRFWFDVPESLATDPTRKRRVLAVDNRGTGLSERPRGVWSMATMADDLAAVLDDAGEKDAIVVGISMGGMIAQHFALRHPTRARGLVLFATTPGFLFGALPKAEHSAADELTLELFQRRAELAKFKGDTHSGADVVEAVVARLREEHVVRLEIAVDDARLARGFEPRRDVLGEQLGLRKLQAALAAELMREVEPAQPLHREERNLAGGRTDLEHADDERAVELGRGLGLAHEARHLRGVAERAGVEQLDRRLAAIVDGRRLVDLAHAAAADQDAEPEAADDLVGEPAGAADLERAIELGARFGEQRLALGDTAHRLLELLHVVERDALRDARGVERDQVDELDHEHDADLVDRARRHLDDAAVLHEAGDDAGRERAVEHGDQHVAGGRDLGVRTETEEVDAERDHRGGRRRGAPVVDAAERAERDQ